MGNFVTYYQGRKVEITQDTYDNFLSGNPGDEGRIGAAFVDDDANLALQEAPHSIAVQSLSPADHVSAGIVSAPAPAADVYASPTPITSTGGLMPAAGDGVIRATTAGGLFGPSPVASPSIAVLPASSGFSIPTWAYVVAAAVLLVVFMERRKG